MMRRTDTHDALPTWLADWDPPGTFDVDAGVFVGADDVRASFPSEGIGVFADVDERSFWFEHRSLVIVDLVSRFAGPSSTMLEVGSGSGAVAARLAAEGHDVMAVEPGAGGAALARRRGVPVAFQGTLHDAALPADLFDVVGLFDVIEHLDEWRSVLAEAGRVLRPDGHVLVTVPAHQWLWSEHDEWNEHRRRYSRSMLRGHFREAGLEVVRTAPLFAPLLPPAMMRRLFSGRGRGDAGAHEARLRSQLEPHPVVNRVLSGVLGIERTAMRWVPMPFGTSRYAVARRAKVRG
ncbi:MAG: class I SAM-dependent methyltransferase [Actinomycetota bacterium]